MIVQSRKGTVKRIIRYFMTILIFVERDKPLSTEEIAEKLKVLKDAFRTESNRIVKQALMEAVPTYHTPEEVNDKAIEADEMKAIVKGAWKHESIPVSHSRWNRSPCSGTGA